MTTDAADHQGLRKLGEDVTLDVRAYELRRAAVDLLRFTQDPSGLTELRSARTALEATLAGGTLPDSEIGFAEDLLARIDAALNPYFD